MTTPEYIQGADLPDLAITWLDYKGDIIDFSGGYTFEVKVGNLSTTALVTKILGITGAAIIPNVVIAWDVVGELNTLPAGVYTTQVKATRVADGKQRFIHFDLRVKESIH
jgi:hypothetical protein